jgi:hypothetical protein
MREEFADFRAVLGGERRDFVEIFMSIDFSFVLVPLLVLVLEFFPWTGGF